VDRIEVNEADRHQENLPGPILQDDERDILVKRLAACGLPTREIVRLTGTSSRTVARILQRQGIRRKKAEPHSTPGKRYSRRLTEILNAYFALEEVTLGTLEQIAREYGITLKKLCDLVREHVSPSRWAIRNCLACGQCALTSSPGDRYCRECKRKVKKTRQRMDETVIYE
jgi:transposase